MKKGTIFLVLAIAVMLFPGHGMARVFFLDQSDLALFAEVYENTGGGYSYLISGGHHYPLGDGYQFYGQHANRPPTADNWVEMGIGVVLEKTASWQSDALVEIGGGNLEGYDAFSMIFSGGPYGWGVTLFVETGYTELGEPNIRYFANWAQFEDGFTPGIINKSTRLTLDLSTIPYRNHVTSLGFAVGRYLEPEVVQTFVVQAYPATSLDLIVYDQGTYNSGFGYDSHYPNETDAATGVTGYVRPENPDRFYAHYHNAFFVFDLTSLNNYITSAKINLELTGYESRDPSESFIVYDVTTPVDELLAGGRGLWSTIGVDLESGAEYGSATVEETDLGTAVSIEFSDAAISDLNASLGDFFTVGVHSTTSDNPEPGVYNIDLISFGEQGDGVQQLELTIAKTLKMQCDLDSDCDVDGVDMVMYLTDSMGISLDIFAADFGRSDCP